MNIISTAHKGQVIVYVSTCKGS